MKSPRKSLVTAMAMGALAILPLSNPRLTRVVDRSGLTQGATYSSQQKEFWLSEEEITYVRPGFHITVNSITIGADRKPVVDLSFTDDAGQPLDRNGAITPGVISVSQILAWYDTGARHYTSYTTRKQTSPLTGNTATQAAADSGGTWNDVDLGHSIYTFKTALPEGFDQTRTTTLGIYATRNLTDIVGKNYYANVEQDFRPDGGTIAATDTWDKTNNAACNTCHNPLSAHGGSRQDVKLCVLCHQPQTSDPDTGLTVDMKVMIHKIHRGESLPSVEAGTPYIIIGNSQSVHNFSDVVFPQDIRNCQTCHGTAGENSPTQTNVWFTFPGRAACQSCHDDVNFDTGENHPAGAYADDSQCASCHQPQGGAEWDPSITGAHTVPYKSTQLLGLQAEIVSVTNATPGQTPTMQFRITKKDGTAIPPSFFTTSSGGSDLNLVMGGPTADYAINPFRERGDHSTFAGDTATYTFTNPIPADATGTWAFSIEARHATPLDPHPADATSFTEGALNPVFYANVSGGDPEPRRMVVDLANCNSCHGHLALHGGQRLNTEECVICHNPNADDSSRRSGDQGAPESIDFKRMIHRIHTGAELTKSTPDFDCKASPEGPGCFTIYGFNGSVNNFNDVRFPGDRRDCAKCHANDSQQVAENADPNWLPTVTQRDWYSPQKHNAAACLGCHDSQAAAAHAFVMTAPFGEACATCHGPGTDFAVDKVHAR